MTSSPTKEGEQSIESTDAAGRVLHPSPMRPDAGHGVQRNCLHDGTASELFFFFFFFLGLAPTRLNSHRFGFNLCRTGLIRPELGRIGHIGLYQPVTKTNRNGRNKPKQAEIGLESSWNSRNSHLKGILMCFLPSSFFVL